MAHMFEALHERRIVSFEVAGRPFGLWIGSVVEIVPMARLSRPPSMPSILEGFLNLGGAAVPVLRLDRLFGLSKLSPGPYSPLLILRAACPLALLVERVNGIVPAGPDRLVTGRDQTSFNGCIEADLMSETGVIHIVSADRLLLDQERKTIAEFQTLEADRLRDLQGTNA
jgi:purine-binding chemotaxis protein CheW